MNIGIDLGTTNSALGYVSEAPEDLVDFQAGMLQLWCVVRDGHRWKLEFNVREKVNA